MLFLEVGVHTTVNHLRASNLNVIAPPHTTQTQYWKSGTTTRAVFHPLAQTQIS